MNIKLTTEKLNEILLELVLSNNIMLQTIQTTLLSMQDTDNKERTTDLKNLSLLFDNMQEDLRKSTLIRLKEIYGLDESVDDLLAGCL